MFREVIVPLDGSPAAECALLPAAEIARKFGAQITLLRAFEGPERAVESLVMLESGPALGQSVDPVLTEAVVEAAEEAEPRARAYLLAVTRQIGGGVPVRLKTYDNKPEDAIIEAAGDDPHVLIVMASHGRGGLERMVFGSVADAVHRKSRAPLLLIPARSAEAPVETENMDIKVGESVQGVGAKLGEVSRLIVDEQSGQVTDLVVKHGFIFGGERVVPLQHVQRVEDNTVHVDLDEDGFKAMNGFAEHVSGRDPDYIGPPDQDQDGVHRGNGVLDQAVAMGPLMAYGGGKPLGYPGGEQLSPDTIQRPAVAPGMAIVDRYGEKVGSVGELAVRPEDGMPSQVTLRRGLLFKHDTPLPAEWIDSIGTDGIVLTVTKADVDQLEEADKK